MTEYDDILARAVSEGIHAFQAATGSPFGCGFAKIQSIHGNSGLVRHFKKVGTETHPKTFEHPTLPVQVRKDDYNGGYTLSVTGLQKLADGPEYQTLGKKQPMYRAVLDVLQEHEVDAGGRVYTRLD